MRAAKVSKIHPIREVAAKHVYVLDKTSGTIVSEYDLHEVAPMPINVIVKISMYLSFFGTNINDLAFLAEDKTQAELKRQCVEVVEEMKANSKNNVRLTAREKSVLGGIIECKSNKEIASGLNLSERTIKFYVSSLLVKHNVNSRTKLAAARLALSGATDLCPA